MDEEPAGFLDGSVDPYAEDGADADPYGADDPYASDAGYGSDASYGSDGGDVDGYLGGDAAKADELPEMNDQALPSLPAAGEDESYSHRDFIEPGGCIGIIKALLGRWGKPSGHRLVRLLPGGRLSAALLPGAAGPLGRKRAAR